MQVRAKIIVSGAVQGVGYRFYAHREATALGVHGYVKNLADGSVLSEVEGERGLIEEYIAALRVGPPWAHVADVAVEWARYAGEFHRFNVAF